MLTGLAVGVALPLNTLQGDPGRLLVTFLGLIAASILPTVSLILGSMTVQGRSVHALERLGDELSAAVDALFLIFGTTALAVIALIAIAIPTRSFLGPAIVSVILERLGQGVVGATTGLILARSGQIPAILRRSLTIRRQIAVEEAKRQTLANAPSSSAIRTDFVTHSEFGKTIDIKDV